MHQLHLVESPAIREIGTVEVASWGGERRIKGWTAGGWKDGSRGGQQGKGKMDQEVDSWEMERRIKRWTAGEGIDRSRGGQLVKGKTDQQVDSW